MTILTFCGMRYKSSLCFKGSFNTLLPYIKRFEELKDVRRMQGHDVLMEQLKGFCFRIETMMQWRRDSQ